MKVKVTAEHIKKGFKGNCTECPIALALVDMGLKYVSVGADGEDVIVYFDPKTEKRVKRYLPPEAEEFMTTFDHDEEGKVQPFEFDLD